MLCYRITMKILNKDELAVEILKRAKGHSRPFLVALDGLSGSGKTTLSQTLGKQLNAAVILGDNFYAGGQLGDWAPRTPKQKADGAMDWRRMRAEALEPLLQGTVAEWRTFNWETGVGLSTSTITCEPNPIIILDGAFSSRPELADIVDLSVLAKIPDDIRRKRLDKREGVAFMAQWHQVWDESEAYYYANVRPDASFDVVLFSD